MRNEQLKKADLQKDDYVIEDTVIDESIISSIPNEVFNITDEEINASLDALNMPKAKRTRTKKSAMQETEEIVNAYINDRTDKNWKKLQERFWYGIKKYSYMFVKNWETADDMTIETFMKALSAIDGYDPEKSKFSTWLWTICKNNCLLYLKKESRIQKVDSDISDIYDSTMAASCRNMSVPESQYIITSSGDVRSISNVDIIQKLYDTSVAEIKNIGGTAGTILEMKLVQNKKIREIGQALNMNESTVKNYLYKGKEDLSNIMRTNHKDLYEMYLESNAERDERENQQEMII